MADGGRRTFIPIARAHPHWTSTDLAAKEIVICLEVAIIPAFGPHSLAIRGVPATFDSHRLTASRKGAYDYTCAHE